MTARERASAYVAKVPGAVEGHHGDCQTLAVANVLIWDFALSPCEAWPILREYNQRCEPPWTEQDLHRKLQSAEQQPHSKPRGNLLGEHFAGRAASSKPTASKPPIDPAKAVENFLNGFRAEEVDLWEASPIRPSENWTQDATALVGSLYLPGELINFVSDYELVKKKDGTIKANPKGYGVTMERDRLVAHWRKHGMPVSEAGGWLRMNPLNGKGINDSNVKAFRFALLESDILPFDLALSLYVRLPLPIAAILTSGGRGPHAWVQVDAQDAEDYGSIVAKIISLVALFGLDSGNTNPSRLSRLPGVTRRIGAAGDGRQRLLYLNPEAECKAIL